MTKKKDSEAREYESPGPASMRTHLREILDAHLCTEVAIAECIQVCGPFKYDPQRRRKRISKVASTEDDTEVKQPEPKVFDDVENRKIEVLKELERIGMGQADKIRSILRKMEELNDENARAMLASPMARHELMTLLAEQGLRLPLWVSGPEESPPVLVGAIGANDKYKLSINDYCAAYIDDMWILGEVRRIAENGRYEVRDVDDAEKPLTTLARRRVIPLPRYRADPQRDPHALFPKNTWIFALYPQTTVFYKGIVDEPPREATEPYRVSFDDPTYDSGFSPPLEVPQRYVLAFREVAYKPRDKDGTKEESKEEAKLERTKEKERIRMELKAEKKAWKKQEKARLKEEKKLEKQKIKLKLKEEKRLAREIRRKEKKREKNQKYKMRRLQKKLEEEAKVKEGGTAEVETKQEEEEPDNEEEEKEESEEEEKEEEEEENEDDEEDDDEDKDEDYEEDSEEEEM